MAERDDKGRFLRVYRGGRIEGWDGGMNNRHDNVELPVNQLRNAVNVDILKSGKVRSRRGIVSVAADAGAHSLFAVNDFMLWATPTAFKKCTPNFTVTTLASSTAYAQPISYVEVNRTVYFTNPSVSGKITPLGALEVWGVVPPTVPPAVTSIDVAASKIKEYQVTVTFVTSSGEESGAPTAAKVLCGPTPIIRLTAIPSSLDPRVTHVRIYVTEVNGTMFYKHSDVANGVTTTTIYVPLTTLGKKLDSQHMTTMPTGQLIEHYNGRIYVAKDNIVYFSEALRYGLHNPVHGYYMFPERVTLLKSVDTGIFVSSDVTYFIEGSPQPATKGSTVTLKTVFPYKAVEGAHCALPKNTGVAWMSAEGVVISGPDGQAENVTDSKVAMDQMSRACMGPVEYDGFRGVVTIARDSTLNSAVSEDYIESEVTRLTEM